MTIITALDTHSSSKYDHDSLLRVWVSCAPSDWPISMLLQCVNSQASLLEAIPLSTHASPRHARNPPPSTAPDKAPAVSPYPAHLSSPYASDCNTDIRRPSQARLHYKSRISTRPHQAIGTKRERERMYFISLNVHRPEFASAKPPVGAWYQYSLPTSRICSAYRVCRWAGRVQDALWGSSIFLMVPATQAASRRITNSKPSFDIRVT